MTNRKANPTTTNVDLLIHMAGGRIDPTPRAGRGTPARSAEPRR